MNLFNTIAQERPCITNALTYEDVGVGDNTHLFVHWVQIYLDSSNLRLR